MVIAPEVTPADQARRIIRAGVGEFVTFVVATRLAMKNDSVFDVQQVQPFVDMEGIEAPVQTIMQAFEKIGLFTSDKQNWKLTKFGQLVYTEILAQLAT